MADKEEYERSKANKQAAIEKKYSERWWVRFKEPISVFTFVLSISTIALTWVAVLQKRTLDRTDETLRANERAFVNVKNWEIIPEKDEKSQSTQWKPQVLIGNSGNTPTKNLHILQGMGSSDDDPIDPEEHMDGLHTTPFSLGPRVDFQRFCNVVSSEKMKVLLQSNGREGCWGAIRYYDIFPGSKRHITKFCYLIRAFADQDGNLKPESYMCLHWNCADDECEDDKKEYLKHHPPQ